MKKLLSVIVVCFMTAALFAYIFTVSADAVTAIDPADTANYNVYPADIKSGQVASMGDSIVFQTDSGIDNGPSVKFNGGAGNHVMITGLLPGTTYTFACYAKLNAGDWAALVLKDTSNTQLAFDSGDGSMHGTGEYQRYVYKYTTKADETFLYCDIWIGGSSEPAFVAAMYIYALQPVESGAINLISLNSDFETDNLSHVFGGDTAWVNDSSKAHTGNGSVLAAQNSTMYYQANGLKAGESYTFGAWVKLEGASNQKPSLVVKSLDQVNNPALEVVPGTDGHYQSITADETAYKKVAISFIVKDSNPVIISIWNIAASGLFVDDVSLVCISAPTFAGADMTLEINPDNIPSPEEDDIHPTDDADDAIPPLEEVDVILSPKTGENTLAFVSVLLLMLSLCVFIAARGKTRTD